MATKKKSKTSKKPMTLLEAMGGMRPKRTHKTALAEAIALLKDPQVGAFVLTVSGKGTEKILDRESGQSTNAINLACDEDGGRSIKCIGLAEWAARRLNG